MANLKSLLVQKLEKALATEFRSPDTIKLQEHDGIVGVITSKKFARMDTIERQQWIWEIIASKLNKEERRHVQVVVGVTPDEGDGYLASED